MFDLLQGCNRALGELRGGGGGSRNVGGRSSNLHTPSKNPVPNFVGISVHHLTLYVSMLGVRLSLAQKTKLVTVVVTLGRQWCCRVML
jgi:hypothetical protein